VISLVFIELRRLFARRLFRLLTVLAVLGILLAGTITLARSHRPSAAQVAQARQSEIQDRRECESGRAGFQPPPDMSLHEFCSRVKFADVEPGFHLVQLTDILKGTTVPLVLLAWLLGASFVGAEWHAGTITTQLTWEPRRTRLLAAKAAAVLLGAFAGYLVLQALVGLALVPAAVLRGTTVGIDGRWLVTTLGVLLRGGGLVAVSAAVGFSLAMVARGTAAALGIGFGYLLILENLIAALRPGWRSWMFGPNAILMVHGKRLPDVAPRSVLQAGLLLGAYAAAFLIATGAMFARRDVT
jgi:ABC-2 type transport system permease protein